MLKKEELVTLKSGYIIPEIILITTTLKLKWLKQNYPNAFQYLCLYVTNDQKGVMVGHQFYAELDLVLPPFGISERVKAVIDNSVAFIDGSYQMVDPRIVENV